MNPILRFPVWPAFALSLCCHALILLFWPAAGTSLPNSDTSTRDLEVTLAVPRPAPVSLDAGIMRHIVHLPAPAAERMTQAKIPLPALPPITPVISDNTIPAAPTATVTPVVMATPVAAEVPLEPPRFHAAYLDNPAPVYPLAARRRGIEGKVLVRAEVLDNGNCSQVMLKQSSGHDLLDQAALAAVKHWRFVPARQGEKTLVAWVDVPIVFRLQD